MSAERVDKLENNVRIIEGKINEHISQFTQFMKFFQDHTTKEEVNLEKRFERLERVIESLADKLENSYVRHDQFDIKCNYFDERIRKNEGVVNRVAWTIIGAVILSVLSFVITK